MSSRAIVILAVWAVLCGAPSSASAAGRNELIAPQASPTSGTITTTFSFTVTYAGGSPALSVTVDVAGRKHPLLLVSGTPTNGTWSVSTLLPQGSWSTTFQAVASQGKNPWVTGPTVTVGALSTSPSPSTRPMSTNPGAPTRSALPKPGGAGGGSGGSGTPASPAAPAATDQAAPFAQHSSEQPAAPRASPIPLPPTPLPSAAGAVGPVSSDGTKVDESPGARGSMVGPDIGGSPVLAPRHANAPPAAGTAPIPTENAVEPLEIAVGLGGAGGILLFGWFLVVAGRRRRATTEPSRAGAEVRTPAGTADEQVTAALYRRTLRRSKIRFDEDPTRVDERTVHPAQRSTRRSPPT